MLPSLPRSPHFLLSHSTYLPVTPEFVTPLDELVSEFPKTSSLGLCGCGLWGGRARGTWVPQRPLGPELDYSPVGTPFPHPDPDPDPPPLPETFASSWCPSPRAPCSCLGLCQLVSQRTLTFDHAVLLLDMATNRLHCPVPPPTPPSPSIF